MFALNKEHLRQRQMAAMQLRHDRGLTDKMIAYAIGVHPDTVGNWRTGVSEIPVSGLLALEALFASMQDWGFLDAVCGSLAARRRQRAAKLLSEAHKLIESAELLEGEAAA